MLQVLCERIHCETKDGIPQVIAPKKVDPAAVRAMIGQTQETTALRVARDLVKNRPAG